ncbi:MAG TPA: 30S ribosomal protein S2 [Chlamydiales bacterium]|nr:30S ribosomal protein S2 [Chlamydiales bacterium]
MATKEQVSVKDLLESGAHFGHQKNRWNPKMKRFIFEERNGIYIIDLAKTMQQIRDAKEVVQNIVTQRKSILFVGTKKQAKSVVKECADLSSEFYVCERWLGGMLTNLKTIRQSVKTLERNEKRIAQGQEGLTKKEFSQLTKDQEKLEKNLSGIRSMRKIPGLLIVVDPSEEHLAVAEAKKLNIPVMALIDTNCDPDKIDHVIACNDDSLKSIRLILSTITQAIVEKKKEMSVLSVKNEKADKEENAEDKEQIDE